MKIVNLNSGLPYHLSPGTQLEVERTNLFFNEWGEQTLPVDLPDTDHNRRMLGYPEQLSSCKKLSTRIPVTIQDGEYFMPCRQAILGAQRKNSISTSFYMNEGSFLSRLAEVSLADILGDETIPGITTVEQGIEFCRSLVSGSNPHYAIFPVLIDSEETYTNGYPKYKYINRWGYVDEWGQFHDSLQGGKDVDFYNAVVRSETVNGETITLNPGFYMTPFVRGNYLLTRIFSYFGYTMVPNFFTRTAPFPDLVFVNNCADSLVNGTIKVLDLLPDSMCTTILEVYRKKFCCEFIPNEVNQTVDIRIFDEVSQADPVYDLTPYLTSFPKIDTPENYQQLILSSEEQVSDSQSVEKIESLTLLFSKYPCTLLDRYEGYFCRTGYIITYNSIGKNYYLKSINEIVANSSMRYFDGGSLKTKEVVIPDRQLEFRRVYLSDIRAVEDKYEEYLLYIGAPNFLNSKLMHSASTEENLETETDRSDNTNLKPMIAFFYSIRNNPRGTISNYGMVVQNDKGSLIKGERLFDYSLCYNGEDGIFERFYRKYDDLHRNSLFDVQADFLLPDSLKQSLPAHLPVLLNGQKLFINTLSYVIGGKQQPISTKLLTMKLYEPISSAKPIADYFPNFDFDLDNWYVWVLKYGDTKISKSEYDNSPYRGKGFDVFYPDYPSKNYVGQQMYKQYSLWESNGNYYKRTFWLESTKFMDQ